MEPRFIHYLLTDFCIWICFCWTYSSKTYNWTTYKKIVFHQIFWDKTLDDWFCCGRGEGGPTTPKRHYSHHHLWSPAHEHPLLPPPPLHLPFLVASIPFYLLGLKFLRKTVNSITIISAQESGLQIPIRRQDNEKIISLPELLLRFILNQLDQCFAPTWVTLI